jgi:hypothetical protein
MMISELPGKPAVQSEVLQELNRTRERQDRWSPGPGLKVVPTE